MSVIPHPLPDDIGSWEQTEQIVGAIHTEELVITSIAGGYLNVEPFCIPNTDCRIVGALVYHCCGTGLIHSWDDEVIKHVFQHGDDTCIKLSCWDVNPKAEEGEPDLCWISDPCKRAEELNCCLYERAKNGLRTSWSFRDRSGDIMYLSADKLCQMIAKAEAECEAMTSCTNNRCITYGCNLGRC